MNLWSKLFFAHRAIAHTHDISPYTQNNAIKAEHEKLMQEQYAMTHPKCEKDTIGALSSHGLQILLNGKA